MDYKEIAKASRKFEVKLVAFIEEHLKKYPTYEILRERADNGELLCIDYRTLEISIRNESELEEKPYESNHWRRFKFLHSYDFLFCTKDDYQGRDKRIVNNEDSDGIAYGAVDDYIRYNGIKDYWSLPTYLLPTPEELAEEQERERKYKEEQERKRLEKERIRAEHVYSADATPVMLILPDIHGRTFWKKAVETYPCLPVVFLGDYLDPYYNSIEQIKVKEALPNFLDILQYKQEHKEQVTLLLGNHDLHYLSDDIDCSRKNIEQMGEIRKLFTSHLNEFQVALTRKIGETTFLLSHAGVVPGWLDIRFPDIDKTDAEGICNALNSRLHSDSTFSSTLIADASCYRGGLTKFGSPVWADIVEHEENKPYSTRKKEYPYMLPGNIMQIFGHTQQEEDPIYRSHFCCLDCRRPFLLTSDGQIMEAF